LLLLGRCYTTWTLPTYPCYLLLFREDLMFFARLAWTMVLLFTLLV
jgi:hypothetical protein